MKRATIPFPVRLYQLARRTIDTMGDDCKIYVGSLSYQTDDNSLSEHFRQIGNVLEGEFF